MEITISDVFDTLYYYQKNRVYEIIGAAVNEAKMGRELNYDLSFLSNSLQQLAVKAMIDQAIIDAGGVSK